MRIIDHKQMVHRLLALSEFGATVAVTLILFLFAFVGIMCESNDVYTSSAELVSVCFL